MKSKTFAGALFALAAVTSGGVLVPFGRGPAPKGAAYKPVTACLRVCDDSFWEISLLCRGFFIFPAIPSVSTSSLLRRAADMAEASDLAPSSCVF